FTHFPPAAVVGARRDPRLAEAVGSAMGCELRAVGIDLDFAPVLDVWSNPRNRVIGDRAFGTDPARVARLGAALARGLGRAGVLHAGALRGRGARRRLRHAARLPVARRGPRRHARRGGGGGGRYTLRHGRGARAGAHRGAPPPAPAGGTSPQSAARLARAPAPREPPRGPLVLPSAPPPRSPPPAAAPPPPR